MKAWRQYNQERKQRINIRMSTYGYRKEWVALLYFTEWENDTGVKETRGFRQEQEQFIHSNRRAVGMYEHKCSSVEFTFPNIWEYLHSLTIAKSRLHKLLDL